MNRHPDFDRIWQELEYSELVGAPEIDAGVVAVCELTEKLFGGHRYRWDQLSLRVIVAAVLEEHFRRNDEESDADGVVRSKRAGSTGRESLDE